MDEIIIERQPYRRWNDDYYISAYGDIYSIRRNIILKHKITKNGHHEIYLSGKWNLVHRMVYQIWVGPITNGLLVLHKDDNKDNNHYSNLYLGTQQDNMEDRVRNGNWNGGGPSNKLVLFDKKTHETLTFNRLQDFLGYYGLTGHHGISDLRSRDWFNERYDIISYEKRDWLESRMSRPYR